MESEKAKAITKMNEISEESEEQDEISRSHVHVHDGGIDAENEILAAKIRNWSDHIMVI